MTPAAPDIDPAVLKKVASFLRMTDDEFREAMKSEQGREYLEAGALLLFPWLVKSPPKDGAAA